MAKYRCTLDKNTIEAASDPNNRITCDYCGNNNMWFKIKNSNFMLILKSSKFKFVVFEDVKKFSRDNFRILGGEDYKFVNRNCQFEIKKSSDEWVIKGITSVTNSTFLNGNCVDGAEKELNEDDKIEVGPIVLIVGFEE